MDDQNYKIVLLTCTSNLWKLEVASCPCGSIHIKISTYEWHLPSNLSLCPVWSQLELPGRQGSEESPRF